MPRCSRIKSKTDIYHIMIRGINKQSIFEDDEDCEKLLQSLQKYKVKCGYQIYAYCFMKNHFHLLLKVNDEPLEQIMRRVCGSYVYWYNHKYGRIGNLFQDRFKSEPVNDNSYLFTVLRYIHQNPIKAGITKDITEYKWSSYNDYIKADGLTDVNFILTFFHKNDTKAKKLFMDYVNAANNDTCLEMSEPHRISDLEAKEIIKTHFSFSSLQEIQGLDVQKRNMLIRSLKQRGLSIRQIERLTGINRGVVFKL